MDDLRELLKELEARPLFAAGPRRRRLPKAASKFIQRTIESCRAEGKTIRHCVTRAYWQAKGRKLLP
jgi:hypothetical protein